MSVNRVILVGRLGKDPEIRYSQQGTAVTNFSMATSEKYKGEEKTTWHRLVAFGKTAEIAEKYLSKGSQVYVEGKLQTRSYEKDGQTRYMTEVVANTVQFLDSKPKGDAGYHQQNYCGQREHSEPSDEDD